ncbi:hypothetical protein BKA57DRAFT_276241 [Linnemannia elongata]|nr:hypothetical protein BKA57DRAFT_276241 [Linnemannia elongata]
MPAIKRKTTNKPTRAGNKQKTKKKGGYRNRNGKQEWVRLLPPSLESPSFLLSFLSFSRSPSLFLARSLACLLTPSSPLTLFSFVFLAPSLFIHPIAEIANQRKQLISYKHSPVTPRWGLFPYASSSLRLLYSFFSFFPTCRPCYLWFSFHYLISTPVSRLPS